ncbi:hypothetical protein H1W37_19255 [Stappia taiwanensis]|uniref:AsmA protein n=1 Tax=Stappia taiwanensis TaxID=992267 RepID=A0A838XXL0_9HYPH|nr:hypothetical protein [Stappia taiwanensis]MBA4613801.1 hypothetical protein [Stappia taiwanensis]GGE90888.1 hypothetical protein GCM10007285_18050 [Stappia taiwanensis]
MTRLLALAAAILILGLALFFGPRWLVTGETARLRAEAELSDWLGASVRLPAAPSVEFLPEPRLSLSDVRLESVNGLWSLSAGRIHVRLDVFALVFGEMRFTAFQIENPRIRLGDGVLPAGANWRDGLRAAARGLHRLTAYPLTVTDGVLLGDAGEMAPLIDRISLRFVRDGQKSSIRGGFQVSDQPVDMAVSLADRDSLIGKAGGAVAVTLEAPLASLRLDGELTGAGGGPLAGQFAFAASDLRGLGQRLGYQLAAEAAFGAGRLAGTGQLSFDALTLDSARIELDGNLGEGQLAFDMADPRPRLDGTLAFERLDLSAYLHEAPVLARGAWRRAPLADVLRQMDLDLRVSAGDLIAGDLSLRRSGLSLLLRDGDFSFDLSEATLAGGRAAASLRAKPDAVSHGYAATMTVLGEGLDFAALPRPQEMEAWPQGGRMAGRASGVAAGESLDDLLSSYKVTAAVDTRQTRFASDGLATAIGRLGTPGTPATSSGRSTFAKLDLALEIAPDAIAVQRLLAETGKHRLIASGRVSRPEGSLALRGLVAAVEADRPADGEPEGPAAATGVPVLMRGTWSEPLLLPDLTEFVGPPKRHQKTTAGGQ